MVRSREQLGGVLRRMYDDAPRGEKAASIHLFGIKYAHDIREAGLNAREVVQQSGLQASYGSEVQKGLNLAKYVQVKPQYAD